MGSLLSLTIIEHFIAFNVTLRKCGVTCILYIHKVLIHSAKKMHYSDFQGLVVQSPFQLNLG